LNPKPISTRQAAQRSALWVLLAALFGAGIYIGRGPQQALDFLTAYIIELSLSLDNLAMFAVIFTSAGVAPEYQPRVLAWGVWGALAMRGMLVFTGVQLLAHFHWFLGLLGIFLVLAGARLLWKGRESFDPSRRRLLTLARKLLPLTPSYERGDFFVREGKRWMATPLLLVLLTIEVTDVVFAVDSVPAVFAVTRDPLIVYSSNILAVLGLRALYFLLAGAVQRFRYLRQGLAVVLMFVGVKLLIARLVNIPTGWALLVVLVVTAVALLASGRVSARDQGKTPATEE